MKERVKGLGFRACRLKGSKACLHRTQGGKVGVFGVERSLGQQERLHPRQAFYRIKR